MVRLKVVSLIFLYDLKKYYSKAPVISWGILTPLAIILLLYFSAGVFGYSRIVPAMFVVSLLFAATSMSQVAVSFEKMSGSINMLYYMPISITEILLGKLLGGIIYGFLGTFIASIAVLATTGYSAIIKPLFFTYGIIIGSLLFSFISLLFAFAYEPIKAVALLNIVRFLMIFLGGLIIPKPMMPRSILFIVYIFPSVYVADIVRFGLYNTWDYVDPYTSIIMSLIYLAVLIIVAIRIVSRTFYP